MPRSKGSKNKSKNITKIFMPIFKQLIQLQSLVKAKASKINNKITPTFKTPENTTTNFYFEDNFFNLDISFEFNENFKSKNSNYQSNIIYEDGLNWRNSSETFNQKEFVFKTPIHNIENTEVLS